MRAAHVGHWRRRWWSPAAAAAVAVAATTAVTAVAEGAAFPTPAPPHATSSPAYTPPADVAALYARLCTPSGDPRDFPPGADGDGDRTAAHVVCDTAATTVDPCNDFFAYACGGWLARTVRGGKQPREGEAGGRRLRLPDSTVATEGLLDLLRAPSGVGADAAAFVRACVDDKADTYFSNELQDPNAWASSLHRTDALVAAVPFLGAAAPPVTSAVGWRAALVGLARLGIFPLMYWEVQRDELADPYAAAMYLDSGGTAMDRAAADKLGDTGVATLIRTALTFAAPVLGVPTDNATVAGVAALMRSLTDIAPSAQQLSYAEAARQREAVQLIGDGPLTTELLLPQLLADYGCDVNGPDGGVVYLSDPDYLRKRLPGLKLRSGDPTVLRAFLVFELVAFLYDAGVLTNPVWPDGVRPSTTLFAPPPTSAKPRAAPPQPLSWCLQEMQWRSPPLHKALDVAFQDAYTAAEPAKVRLMRLVGLRIRKAAVYAWLPRIGRGWMSRSARASITYKLRRTIVELAGDSRRRGLLPSLDPDRYPGGRLIAANASYPAAFLAASAVAVDGAVQKFTAAATRARWGDRRPNAAALDIVSPAYEPTAVYDEKINLVHVSIALATARFVDERLPAEMSIGAIGSVLGHELMHPLLGRGQRTDSRGLPFNWTTAGDRRGLAAREECYVTKYSRYTPTALLAPASDDGPGGVDGSDDDVPVAPVNGTSSLIENLADVEGTRLAWMALKSYVADAATWRRRRRPSTLGAVWSSGQLFWLGRAQMMCAAYDARALAPGMGGRYAPEEFRVAGPASEVAGFGHAWGCPAGTPNTSKRCPAVFW